MPPKSPNPFKQYIPYPLFVLFAIIAFNITAFTAILLMDVLIFKSLTLKIICGSATVISWYVVYRFRNR